ncbi:MAG TPA: hypothetical protein VFY28_00240 [Candidatus Paceibacterota bacterium]|nr:hypothetical protein [Candidatus Paceibacterota bacterium]
MTRLGAATVLVLLLGYGFVKATPLLAGPAIRLDTPLPYAAVPGGEVTIAGQARNTGTLMMNGGVLLIDEDGHFSTALTLPAGSAILSLTAEDRFGRSVTKQVTVYTP